jgi:hypothetical protein
LADWLPLVIHRLQPFLSDDIAKDARWAETINENLRGSSYGIACITRDNISAPWLNFESGALANSARLSLFLLNLAPNDLHKGPFGQYQATMFEKEDFRKLVRRLNEVSRGPRLDSERLNILFEALWPRLERTLNNIAHPEQPLAAPYPIGGSKPFRGALRAIPPTKLDEFYEQAQLRLDLLGHSFSGLLSEGGRNALLKALANGATIRLIYLDPTQVYSDQIAQIGRRIDHDLRRKIRASLEEAKIFKDSLHTELRRLKPDVSHEEAERARERLQIAATRLISYSHIQRVDGVLLVSQYSQSQDPGRVAPTIEIVREDDPDLFTFYEQEFDRIWEDASPIEEVLSTYGIESDRARVLAHLPSIQQVYRSVKSNDNAREPLPYPRMIVALPNMNCSVVCRNCFTWRSKAMDRRSMETPLLRSLIRQAHEMNASCIELSGGGEPLEHPEVEGFLRTLIEESGQSIRTGVLTNGMAIASKPELATLVMDLDYVRVGFTEYLDDPRHDDEELRFRQALEILGRTRIDRHSAARIGVKLLLSSSNAQAIVSRVTELLELKATGSQRYVVDHIKIKSIRGDTDLVPSASLVRNVEHDLALLKSRYGKRASDLQIDIKSAEVPAKYRCWISPIMTVVDASGDVYLCCNFYESRDDSKIGSLGSSGEGAFADFWGGQHHRSVMQRVSPARVCNSPLGCHCRLVHYQEMAEPFVPYSDLTKPTEIPMFQGHDQML